MPSDTHSQIRKELQQELVPELRRRGFSGSLPNFRRITEGRIALLTVQFDKYGGSFTLELGRAPASDYAPFPGKLIPTTHLSARDLDLAQRARIHPNPGDTLNWFSYKHLVAGGDVAEGLRALARSASALLSEAEAWWAGKPAPPHVHPFAESSSPSTA
jgi:hypothetical protein